MTNFWQDKKVLIPGGQGFLGKYIVDLLKDKDCNIFTFGSSDYDLRYLEEVESLFRKLGKVDIVINLAANVGGIGYNQLHPYSLFLDNIQMGTNLIDVALQANVGKFVQVGTVCAYPKWAIPPFNEKVLWDGYPEETNAPYGLAKKMLLVQLQAARDEFDFNGVYLLPTNLYGPKDEFGIHRSHVIPALIRKFSEAKKNNDDIVEVWGSGEASRDFLYVEDAAEAIVLATEKYNNFMPMNIGSGNSVKISWLAYKIAELVGYQGDIYYNTSMPDGQPKRQLDISFARHALNWQPETGLVDGLTKTIEWYENRNAKN